VTWRNTTLCAPSNDFVIVPNSVIARAHITNFTADSEEHVSSVPLVVKYGSDLREVERIALATATEVRDEFDNAIKEFEPTCRFRAFAPEGITTVVTIRVERYQERVPIVSALVERLYERLGEAGIQLSGIEPPPARK
jgi:small-conductance mechanosensitive channel